MGFSIDRYTELTQVTTYQDTALGIMRWGTNNAFPQTLKNFIEQSPNAKPAVTRTAKFLKGAKFEGSDYIIHPLGLTIGHLVDYFANDFSNFGGFGAQCNYNLNGQVTSACPLPIPTMRFNELDELNFASKIGYNTNFSNNSEIQKTKSTLVNSGNIKWFNRFAPNPEIVSKQIEEAGGIQKYNGQILYYSNAGFSSYPIPVLQSQINYVLSDVENSILVRKETATGFINSYILKTTMTNDDASLIALEDALAEAQGARGSGKIITFSGLSDEEITGTLLEEIGSGASGTSTIIDASEKAYDLSKKAIIGAYLIPPILAGADQATGFTSDDLKNGYDIFNAITQEGRDIIESEVNKILAASVFDVKSIKLVPLSLEEEQAVNADTEDEEVESFSDDEKRAQASLRGSVGGVQGILSIQESVASENTTREAAITTLMKIYGFNRVDSVKLLGEPKSDTEKLEDEEEIKEGTDNV